MYAHTIAIEDSEHMIAVWIVTESGERWRRSGGHEQGQARGVDGERPRP